MSSIEKQNERSDESSTVHLLDRMWTDDTNTTERADTHTHTRFNVYTYLQIWKTNYICQVYARYNMQRQM